MESKQAFIFSLVLSFALFSFVLCIVADYKRSKAGDQKFDDGRLCHVPQSQAFRFGVAALTCLVAAQIVGNILVLLTCCTTSNNDFCCFFRSKDDDDEVVGSEVEKRSTILSSNKATIAAACLMVFSWLSFGTALVLISVATSMNKTQVYGEGWLDGECYLVRNGIFTGSAVLVLLSISSTLGSAIVMMRHRQEQIKNLSLNSGI